MIDFEGRSFSFYHNRVLPGGGGFKRSVCVEEFTYNADGTIPTIKMTTEGAPQIAPLNPYEQVEAETIAWQEGVETEVCSEGGMNVSEISNGDYIKVAGVDFGTGAVSFEVRAAADSEGGNIELHLGSKTGGLPDGDTAGGSAGGASTATTDGMTGASGAATGGAPEWVFH